MVKQPLYMFHKKQDPYSSYFFLSEGKKWLKFKTSSQNSEEKVH